MKDLKFSGIGSLLAALGAIVLGSLGLAGCGGSAGSEDGPGGSGDGLQVGFLYVGPKDDYGYNQAHAAGAAAVKKMKGVSITEQESVPETNKVTQAMEDMIGDGAKVIFPTSFGYYEFVPDLAKQHPGVMFLHCGGLYQPQSHPKNISTYFGFIDECQYISGIIAGHTTKTKKLGFVAAKPIPQVLRNVNAFTLGARSVDPLIECHVIFTGDWSNSKQEADAVSNLARKKVDVITCHVDSPKTVVENARNAGIYICGYHASQQDLAPNLYLTGAEWNWEKVYTDYIKMIKEGKPIPNVIRGGLKEGTVKMSPYNRKLVSDKAIKAADAVKAKLMAGTFVIFKGPLKDNEGKSLFKKGEEHVQTDSKLEQMTYLVEGVVGKK